MLSLTQQKERERAAGLAWTPGTLYIKATGNKGQFEIASDYMRSKGEWDDVYVSFSGYFGSYGPHLFAAAPEMFEALKLARAALGATRARDAVDAALSRAGEVDHG